MLNLITSKTKACCILVLGFTSFVSQAQFNDGCDNEKTTNLSYLRCLDSKIVLEKRTVEMWTNKILIDLEKKQNETGNLQLLRVFKRAEQEFDKYVEDNCRWRYLSRLPDTIAAAIAFKRCEVYSVQKQIEILQLQ